MVTEVPRFESEDAGLNSRPDREVQTTQPRPERTRSLRSSVLTNRQLRRGYSAQILSRV